MNNLFMFGLIACILSILLVTSVSAKEIHIKLTESLDMENNDKKPKDKAKEKSDKAKAKPDKAKEKVKKLEKAKTKKTKSNSSIKTKSNTVKNPGNIR